MVAAAGPARAQPLPLQLLEDTSADPADPADPAGLGGTPLPSGSSDVPLPVVAEPEDADAQLGLAHDQHIVVAGESFWRIAAERVADATGGRPSDDEVAVYWRRLIEQNRSRLADPGNPDLLFPGQQLRLPPVAG